MVAKGDTTAAALERRYARSERMVGRRIAGEYVLVPIVGHGADLDAIYNLNALGAFIWERLDGKSDGQVIVESIVERYEISPETAARDYQDFIVKLSSINAVRATT